MKSQVFVSVFRNSSALLYLPFLTMEMAMEMAMATAMTIAMSYPDPSKALLAPPRALPGAPTAALGLQGSPSRAPERQVLSRTAPAHKIKPLGILHWIPQIPPNSPDSPQLRFGTPPPPPIRTLRILFFMQLVTNESNPVEASC